MRSPDDEDFMGKGGGRMRDVDPEFARLISALRTASPSKEAVARTLGAVSSCTKVLTVPPAPRPARSAALTWIVAAAAFLALSAVGYAWSQDVPEPPRSVPALFATLAASAAPGERGPRSSAESAGDVPTATMEVGDLPPVPPRSSAGVTKPSPQRTASAKAAGAVAPPPNEPASAAPPSDPFREELALVERARTALSRGDAAACLRSLEQYAERFRGGAFAHEVEVMRVEALAISGDGEKARAFGSRFLAQYPTSPYAERVRSVLDRTK